MSATPRAGAHTVRPAPAAPDTAPAAVRPVPRAASRAARPGRGRRHRWLPPQHGAWAMLLLPYAAAVWVAGPRWSHLPLLGAWLAGYLFSYYAMLAVKTGRPARVRPQLLVYGGTAALLVAPVVVARPAILGYAPLYALLAVVNVGHARRRRERALLNDLASVAQSVLMVFVVATVAGVSPGALVGVAGAVGAYLVGTVLYVKTMIRERGRVGYRAASAAHHLAALLIAAAWWGPAVTMVFALLLLRAALLPGRRLTAVRVGVIELVGSLLVFAAVVEHWS
ncbi:YwiC-like family protein [Micromonospora soli]|uniref:YwiC-like family protein n=1 Tax=Micromonospora sp. NBRC 110009 TaxID=3061627 RepID=UPI002673BCC4|nr:YwiC-like family protein [Micromonospora sp. NBRC 110009]WKT99124.1 YwiC-like family protein [Micromonospora sp. NBRC 110009]